MDKSLKEKWIKKLTSGKYRQCQNSLKKETRDGGVSFCCLGILAECIDPDYFTEEKFKYQNNRTKAFVPNSKYFPSFVNIGMLPDFILNKIRLISEQQNILIEMNDNKGKKFKTIAKWIEENL
jgi:hypothetical protein